MAKKAKGAAAKAGCLRIAAIKKKAVQRRRQQRRKAAVSDGRRAPGSAEGYSRIMR
jgi:hypothetical protein